MMVMVMVMVMVMSARRAPVPRGGIEGARDDLHGALQPISVKGDVGQKPATGV
jgi:hypothetical protein